MRNFIQLCDSIVNNVSCLLIGYWRLQSSPKIFRKWILKGLLFTWSLFRTTSLILVIMLTGELMQHLKICLPIAWYGNYVADNWSLLVFPLSFKINMFFYSNETAVRILFSFIQSWFVYLFFFEASVGTARSHDWLRLFKFLLVRTEVYRENLWSFHCNF